jgi:hypothetical protein
MKWILCTLFLAVLLSCASAPAPEAPDPEAPVPPPETLAADTPADSSADSSAEKNRALEAMNKARSVKAEVAVKAVFDEAMTIYGRAESLVASGSAAGNVYLEAEKNFLAAYEAALAKREQAERQLALAREAVKQAEETAAAFDAGQEEGEEDSSEDSL